MEKSALITSKCRLCVRAKASVRAFSTGTQPEASLRPNLQGRRARVVFGTSGESTKERRVQNYMLYIQGENRASDTDRSFKRWLKALFWQSLFPILGWLWPHPAIRPRRYVAKSNKPAARTGTEIPKLSRLSTRSHAWSVTSFYQLLD